MRYILAIFLPPLAVLLCGKIFQFLLSIVLTLCFWIPGVIHALFVVNSTKHEEANEKVIREMRKQEARRVKSDRLIGP